MVRNGPQRPNTPRAYWSKRRYRLSCGRGRRSTSTRTRCPSCPCPTRSRARRLCARPSPTGLHPQPSTLHPTPYTLSPQPSTLNPQPSTLHPPPSIPNPQLSTLHPQPPTGRAATPPRCPSTSGHLQTCTSSGMTLRPSHGWMSSPRSPPCPQPADVNCLPMFQE